MGRPLFVARVESDLPSEKSAAEARSTIRRANRRRGSPRVPSPPTAIPSLPNSRPSEDVRVSYMRDRASLTQLFGIEPGAGLPRPTGLRPSRHEDVPTYALPWDVPLEGERAERERVRRLVQQGRVSQASRAAHRSSPPGRASAAAAGRLSSSRRFGLSEQSSSSRSSSSARFRRAFEEYASSRGENGVDGLGDRNRSMSPEGVHVWDTLLTSITPDPQPPSLGSSFASTAASQSAAGSAATSFTEPDPSPDMALAADPGCESGPEERDTSDAEEDDELLPAIASGFRRHIPRSHPHPSGRPPVPPRVPESENDSMDDVMGLIRQLARRHNVPVSFIEDMEGLRRERQALS